MQKQTTVKNLLESKYLCLLKDVKIILGQNLLPQLDDDFDWHQFMDYIICLFPNNEYEFHLEELCIMQGIKITKEQIKQLVPIVDQYLVWVLKFKSVYPKF